jgi:hypothetical protein
MLFAPNERMPDRIEKVALNGPTPEMALRPLRTSASARGPPSAPDPSDEVSSALSRYLTSQEYPAPRLSTAILGRIAERTAEAIEGFDFREAELLHQADVDLRRHFEEARLSKSATPPLDRLSSSDLADRLERVNAHYDEKREELDRSAAQSRSDLRQRHAKEQERLAASWKHPSALLRYSKPSAQLRELQRKIRLLRLYRRRLHEAEGRRG